MPISELASGSVITVTEGTTTYEAVFVKAYDHHVNIRHKTRSGGSYNTAVNTWDIQCGAVVMYYEGEKISV
ncbi:MAG: hypothetical protein LUI06_05815 [Ruminococcus sp.]|nr:hypothetical protein [Ruminococcus sp.]